MTSYILISFDDDRSRMYYDGQCNCEKYIIPQDIDSEQFEKMLKTVIKHLNYDDDDDDNDIKKGRKLVNCIVKIFNETGIVSALDSLIKKRFRFHEFKYFQSDDAIGVLSFLTSQNYT